MIIFIAVETEEDGGTSVIAVNDTMNKTLKDVYDYLDGGDEYHEKEIKSDYVYMTNGNDVIQIFKWEK